jgi:hypothetical protein
MERNAHLEFFKDIHKGSRAIVAANGPSLNDIDFSRFKPGEIIFGLNRGYLKEDMPIVYLVTADKRIQEEFFPEIVRAPGIKFCHGKDNGISINAYSLGLGRFSTDVTRGMKLGHSVTIVALQLAFYMGCNPTILVGLDHNITYKDTKSHPGKEYSNREKDHNHFTDDYYPEGYQFRYQNLNAVANSLIEARVEFEKDGRQLLNASTYTTLPDKVIPKVDIEKIYEQDRWSNNNIL